MTYILGILSSFVMTYGQSGIRDLAWGDPSKSSPPSHQVALCDKEFSQSSEPEPLKSAAAALACRTSASQPGAEVWQPFTTRSYRKHSEEAKDGWLPQTYFLHFYPMREPKMPVAEVSTGLCCWLTGGILKAQNSSKLSPINPKMELWLCITTFSLPKHYSFLIGSNTSNILSFPHLSFSSAGQNAWNIYKEHDCLPASFSKGL